MKEQAEAMVLASYRRRVGLGGSLDIRYGGNRQRYRSRG